MSFNVQAAIDAAFSDSDAEIAKLKEQVAGLEHQTQLLLDTANKAVSERDAAKADLLAAQQSVTALQAQIVTLNARILELERGNSGPQPEPEPEPDPVPSAPNRAAFNALTTDAQREKYRKDAQQWYAANTGPKGTLTPYTGPMTITKAGTVIEGKIINGSLTAAVNNVKVKNCQIDYTGTYGVNGYGYSGLTVEDCKITGPGMAGTSVAGIFGGDDLTARRCNISGAEHGIHTQESGVVEWNYIHTQRRGGPDPHYDCVICQGWQNGVIIRDNFLVTQNTSAVLVKQDFGPVKNVKIQRNWIINDPLLDPDLWCWYQIYSVAGNYGGGAPVGTEITDNVLQKGKNKQYFWQLQGSVKLSGNVDFDTGKAAT